MCSSDIANPNVASAQQLAIVAQIFVISLGACVPAERRLPDSLDEISGWVMTSDSTAVAVNDSGNAGYLWSVDLRDGSAERFGESLPNRDWEAVAYDSSAAEFIVCDIGDNGRVRSDVVAYRVDRLGQLRGAYTLVYPRGALDCEACLVRDDTLTLITKAKTLGGGKCRMAYVYQAALTGGPAVGLQLRDSFVLRRRSVTDAVWLDDTDIAVLAYNFQLIGPLPFTKTTIYRASMAGFRQNDYRVRKLRAPFTLTQYESVAVAPDRRSLFLASERTLVFPARWRRIDLR